MATFDVGNALVTFEGLLRPFKLKMSKWQKDDKMYDPLPNEELLSLLTEAEKPGYDYLLRRSSEICCVKFRTEQNSIKNQVDIFIKKLRGNYIDLRKVLAFMDENNIGNDKIKDVNNEEPKVIETKFQMQQIADEFDDLVEELNKLLSFIKELWIKEKGYFNQNPIYKNDVVDLMDELIDHWNVLFNAVKIRSDNYEIKDIIDKHQAFSKEINEYFNKL
jgi:hypothetical protein